MNKNLSKNFYFLMFDSKTGEPENLTIEEMTAIERNPKVVPFFIENIVEVWEDKEIRGVIAKDAFLELLETALKQEGEWQKLVDKFIRETSNNNKDES